MVLIKIRIYNIHDFFSILIIGLCRKSANVGYFVISPSSSLSITPVVFEKPMAILASINEPMITISSGTNSPCAVNPPTPRIITSSLQRLAYPENRSQSFIWSGIAILFSYSHSMIFTSDKGGSNSKSYSFSSFLLSSTICVISSVKLFCGICGIYISTPLNFDLSL